MKIPKAEISTPEDIHNAFICGEDAVTELFISVIDAVKILHTHIEQLREVIQKLQSQAAENSANSSKPPSGDGLKKKHRTGSLRKPGDKPNGGQPGHKGHCLERTSEIFEHLYDHRISEGVIAEADKICADKVAPVADHVIEQLIKSDVVNFDETGIRVSKKLFWLTVASAPELTYYHIHSKRGEQGLNDAGILPEFHGIGIHDHRKAYFKYPCRHGLCNAHHLREPKSVSEQYKQEWAKNLSDLLTEIYHEVKKVCHYQSRLPPETIGESESRYDRIIANGLSVNPPSEKKENRRGRTKQSVPRNLPERLRIYKLETLRFMYDFRVPSDNNRAERDIRMVKVKQKVSGTFRTEKGAEIFCRIRTYISNAKKNACNIIHAIGRAFQGNPFMPITMTE